MKKKTYSQILDEVARDQLAANPDLTPQIMVQIQKGKSATMRPLMKVFVTVFLALLILAGVLIGVPSVRAAIQRWIGYVPGVGLVSEGQIRVLAEPVSITREGITLTVEQVLVDSNQTTLIYSAKGLTAEMLDINPAVNSPGCYKDAVLRFGNNKFSPTGQSGTNWITGYQHRATYSVIPSQENEVTLLVPCLRSAMPGKTPENWELSFRLIPAPPEMTAFPVIEIPTPQPTTPAPLPSAETNAPLSTNGISVTFDRAIQLDDGYLIYATVHWENSGFSGLEVFGPSAFRLLDSKGQNVSYTLNVDETASMPGKQGQTALAFRITSMQVPGPLTIAIDSVSVTKAVTGSFIFDPGSNPKPGQVWELNQDVDLSDGYSLRVLRATYPKPPVEGLPQQAGFSFDMKSDTITGALLIDMAHPPAGGGGGSAGWTEGVFTSGFSYRGAMPEGPITVNVEAITFNFSGHWEAQWTPPATKNQPTPQPSSCLTVESWQQALQQHPSLPAGLTGKLALSKIDPPSHYYEMIVVGLDGSNPVSLGIGLMPSFAPNGNQVVYMGPGKNGISDGLHIKDLISGQTTLLPGSAAGDINPLWSPDGSKIAFTRGPSSAYNASLPHHIIVTNADGSDFRQLTKGADSSFAVAWIPDGNRLIYTVNSQDKISVHIMDVRTGEVASFPNANYNADVFVSPDGNRLAFEERLPLDKYGISISDWDGSNRKLVANGDPYIGTSPLWSADGKWLLINIYDLAANQKPDPTPALIQVDTCEIIPLTNLNGYVSSWVW
jgi:hypothetical protein